MNFKQKILDSITFSGVDKNTLASLIEKPKMEAMGDLSLACFTLAKSLHKSPIVIANEIKSSLKDCEWIDKVECVGGYLNFFFSKTNTFFDVVGEIKEKDFSRKLTTQKTVCVDYCSVNLAKYMHIGHWATTIIGESLARMSEKMGWRVVRINYLGDYGTSFGKMVYAFKAWGNIEDVKTRGVDAIQDLYVKFCASETDELLAHARACSVAIENKTGEDFEIDQLFVEIAKKECERLIKKIGIHFDDWRGESFYNDKMDAVISELKTKGLTKESQGALICDLEEFGLGVAVLQRTDGGSLYITRDLAAAEDRFALYGFDEAIYVTAIQQNRHFAQLFKICELMGKPYAGNMFHASYGMFSLPEGKIASRKGKQALFENLLSSALAKVEKVLEGREIGEKEKNELKAKIAKSAIAFSVLKTDRIKDKVFDEEQAISFDGETAPYIQYSLARINSLLKKFEKIDFVSKGKAFVCSQTCFSIVKMLNDFDEIFTQGFEKKEPSIIARYLILLCQTFNRLYTEEKFADPDNEEKTLAMKDLCLATKNVLVFAMELVCVDVVDVM